MATSLESQIIPPQPEHTPPRAGDNVSDNEALIARPWAEWFNRIRIKVNLINESLANLSGTVGAGFLVGNAGNWLFRSLQGTTGNIVVTNPDGTLGDPAINLVPTSVTPGSYTNTDITVDAFGRITAASNGSGGGSSNSLIGLLPINAVHASVITDDGGFTMTRGGGSGSSPFYTINRRMSGKYAIRYLVTALGAGVQGPAIGFVFGSLGTYLGGPGGVNSIGLWVNSASNNEYLYRNGGTTNLGDLASFTTPTEVMFEVDIDSGNGWIGVAGLWIGGGDPAIGTLPTFTFTPNLLGCPVIDVYYPGTVSYVIPPAFITPASAGFTAGWPP